MAHKNRNDMLIAACAINRQIPVIADMIYIFLKLEGHVPEQNPCGDHTAASQAKRLCVPLCLGWRKCPQQICLSDTTMTASGNCVAAVRISSRCARLKLL